MDYTTAISLNLRASTVPCIKEFLTLLYMNQPSYLQIED